MLVAKGSLLLSNSFPQNVSNLSGWQAGLASAPYWFGRQAWREKAVKGTASVPVRGQGVPAEEDQKASLRPTKNTPKQTMKIKYSATPKDKAIKKNDFGTNGTEINRMAGPRKGCS